MMELEDDCSSPSSPKFDRLSMKSDSPSESLGNGDDRVRMVVTSLLSATMQQDAGVRYNCRILLGIIFWFPVSDVKVQF